MKSKRYTTEQKIRILREAEKAGQSIVEVCREKGISEQTLHRWKREFGMMKLDQAKQLKELQKENARLKRQIAESLVERGRCSERSACRHFGLHRSTFQYKAKEPDAWLVKLKTDTKRHFAPLKRLHQRSN